MNFDALQDAPRLLVEAQLSPVQGTRFQPTGFPDLGAATYDSPDGAAMLLVESPQSMANRLESVCWDEANDTLVQPLDGMPYVVSSIADGIETNSILEAHRLNSPFIVNSKEFKETIEAEIGFDGNKPFDRRRLAEVLLKFDPNSLVHGIFLEKVGGVCRLPRALSAFIEATDVNPVATGGVKFDRVSPGTGEGSYGKAKDGYGNVPFHRDEFTGNITAYFNLDLALIRGLGLGNAAERLLIGLSVFKLRRFLDFGLRLRTACDLALRDLQVTAPTAWTLPETRELDELMPALIREASPTFADPRVTRLTYAKRS